MSKDPKKHTRGKEKAPETEPTSPEVPAVPTVDHYAACSWTVNTTGVLYVRVKQQNEPMAFGIPTMMTFHKKYNVTNNNGGVTEIEAVSFFVRFNIVLIEREPSSYVFCRYYG